MAFCYTGPDMFLAVHASMGALAGTAVSRPDIAFLLGFVSHFFTDMIPHGDEHIYEGFKSKNKVKRAVLYVAADSLASLALVIAFFAMKDFFHPASVVAGIAGGVLPDILVGLGELLKARSNRRFSGKIAWFHKFHMKNHHFLIKRLRKFERDIPLRYGLMIQGVTLAVLLKIIL